MSEEFWIKFWVIVGAVLAFVSICTAMVIIFGPSKEPITITENGHDKVCTWVDSDDDVATNNNMWECK